MPQFNNIELREGSRIGNGSDSLFEMLEGVSRGASRASRTSKLRSILDTSAKVRHLQGRGESAIRGPSIINRVSRVRNFDFLSLRAKSNKYHMRI